MIGATVKAMASEKTGPAPPKKSTIIREEGAPDLPPAANTIFILDLMKQKQEKLRRKKKDDMILEMALKMKKEKEQHEQQLCLKIFKSSKLHVSV